MAVATACLVGRVGLATLAAGHLDAARPATLFKPVLNKTGLLGTVVVTPPSKVKAVVLVLSVVVALPVPAVAAEAEVEPMVVTLATVPPSGGQVGRPRVVVALGHPVAKPAIGLVPDRLRLVVVAEGLLVTEGRLTPLVPVGEVRLEVNVAAAPLDIDDAVAAPPVDVVPVVHRPRPPAVTARRPLVAETVPVLRRLRGLLAVPAAPEPREPVTCDALPSVTRPDGHHVPGHNGVVRPSPPTPADGRLADHAIKADATAFFPGAVVTPVLADYEIMSPDSACDAVDATHEMGAATGKTLAHDPLVGRTGLTRLPDRLDAARGRYADAPRLVMDPADLPRRRGMAMWPEQAARHDARFIVPRGTRRHLDPHLYRADEKPSL